MLKGVFPSLLGNYQLNVHLLEQKKEKETVNLLIAGTSTTTVQKRQTPKHNLCVYTQKTAVSFYLCNLISMTVNHHGLTSVRHPSKADHGPESKEIDRAQLRLHLWRRRRRLFD